MKTHSHRQHHIAHLMIPNIRHRPHGVLAWKCKGVDVAGAEQMRALLPIPLQANAEKLTSKWTAWVLAGGGQLGNDI